MGKVLRRNNNIFAFREREYVSIQINFTNTQDIRRSISERISTRVQQG